MNNHLSSEEICRWMIGECSAEEERHGRDCPVCSAELARFQTALSEFGTSVSHWADQQSGSTAQVRAQLPVTPLRFRMRPLRWVSVAALVSVLAVIPVYQNSINREREAQAAQDTLLMEKIDAHLSRPVPTSLEPLMNLLSDENPSTPER